MARMYYNMESTRRHFGEISHPINWILDSGVTCHLTLEISDFLPVSILEKDKYIEFSDVNFITETQTGVVKIKMSDDNDKLFIATLYNILLTPDLYD